MRMRQYAVMPRMALLTESSALSESIQAPLLINTTQIPASMPSLPIKTMASLRELEKYLDNDYKSTSSLNFVKNLYVTNNLIVNFFIYDFLRITSKSINQKNFWWCNIKGRDKACVGTNSFCCK